MFLGYESVYVKVVCMLFIGSVDIELVVDVEWLCGEKNLIFVRKKWR